MLLIHILEITDWQLFSHQSTRGKFGIHMNQSEAITSLVVFSIAAIPILFLFPLALWFRTRQPLLSRGAVPFCGMITFFFIQITRAIQYIPVLAGVPESGVSLGFCLQKSYFDSPAKLGFMYLLFFQGLRYFVLNTLNKQTEDIRMIIQPSNETQKSSRVSVQKYKWFKFLASGWTMVGGFFAVVLIWYITVTIIGFIYGSRTNAIWTCPHDEGLGGILRNVLFLIYSATFGIAILSVLVYDIVKNFSILRECKIWDMLFYEDPLLFRIEYLLLMLVYILYIVVTLSVYNLNNEVVDSVTTALNGSFIILVNTGLSLIMTIIWSCRKVPKDDDIIQQVLDDPRLYKKFVEFAQKEWYSFSNISQ